MGHWVDDENGGPKAKTIIVPIVAVLRLIGVSMWGCPQYGVWQQALNGKAELEKALYNRKIAVAEAEAKFESSKMLAAAEIERAKGVAQANEIIGNSLKDHEEYLKYLWITDLQNPNKEIVYVPTEAMIPIMEANRMTPLLNRQQ